MRVCIELRRDVNPNVILNQLYKHTQLQDTFGVIMLALVDNEPKVLNLYDALSVYLRHQEDVVTRRTKYDLNKAEERAHILKGLLIALDHIDEVIKIIRAAKNVAEAKAQLIESFGLDDAQAQAIVDMRLRALTGLERERLEQEYADLMKKIEEFKLILSDEKVLLGVIKEEIGVIRDKYGDDRRTAIGIDMDDFTDEDLIPDENTVVAITHLGYIKRMTVDNFKAQHRGGKGIKGMQTIEEDYIEDMFMTTTHHYIMFLTNKGRAYRIKAYEIPEASRTARGTAIINLLQLQPGEKVTAGIALKEFDEERYLFLATKSGIVKKTKIKNFAHIRKTGIQAINLKDDDVLIGAKATNNQKDILLITKHGMSIRFNEQDVRATGRSSMGVIGMTLTEGDEVVSMQLTSQGEYVLVASEFGYGKLTDVNEFSAQRRGGKGVKCYKIIEKTGDVVGAKILSLENEMMIITNEGIIIRMLVSDISIVGRNTSGVKLINIDNEKGIRVASIARVKEAMNTEQMEAQLLDENAEVIDDEEATEEYVAEETIEE